MILNVSGRTDIVAFYTEWFMNRYRSGFVDVRNPFNPQLVSRINFKDVDLILFCTKNPIPILKYIKEIDKPIIFHVTLTPYGKDKITKTEAFFRTRTLVEENRIYAWKNSQGKIVSMASFSIIDNQAKLSNVYTITSERRKGYARNLIYLLTEELIKEQFIPVMYINNNTLPSTKLYLRIGYEKCGVLVNFSCSKNKIKKM